MIDLHSLSTGVVPAADNYALLRLASLLGNSLVFGAGSGSAGPVSEALLVNLSAVLSPVYLGVLILILAYIGIGGTAKTALDGEFLGRDWHSFMVPAGVLLSVMMLSPVPSQSGITFAQVIFVRAVTYGSNFADLILKSAVETQNSIAFNHSQGTPSADNPEQTKYVALVEQTHDRMKSYLPTLLCAESEIAMGEGNSASFFVGLNDICRVPSGAVALYSGFFHASVNTSLDPNAPARQPMTAGQTKGTDQSTAEYECYYNAFKETYLQSSGIPIAFKAGKLPDIPAIDVPWARTETAAAVTAASKRSVLMNAELVRVGWTTAVTNAAECIKRVIPPSPGFASKWSPSSTSAETPQWSHGWSDAAALTKDTFNDANATSSGPLEFTKTDIGQPLVSRIPANSPRVTQITLLQETVTGLIPDLDGLMKGMRIDTLSTTSPGRGNYTDARKIALVSASMGMALYQSSAAGLASAGGVATNIANAGAVGNPALQREGIEFFQRMKNWGGPLGPTSAKINLGFGVGVRAVSSFVNSAWAALGVKMAAEEALKSIPFGGAGAGLVKGVMKLGGKAAGKLGAGINAIAGMPGVSSILLFTLMGINVMTLAPEVTMALALLLWLVRVTAWFMVIPISALIIAIPNTRVGHSAWKEGLALALTPVITILFYIVSLMVQDVIIDVSAHAMFGKYFLDHGWLGTIASFFLDLLSGEALYRIVAFAGLLAAGFFFTVMLVLRGPGWALGKMGLSSGGDVFEGETREMEQGISGKSSIMQKAGNVG
jgi:hypothetical protein